jgi:SAM-dependent methyltransferase
VLLPYLTGETREAFDRWLAATLARHIPPLNFTEVRKGVQALSTLYVHDRKAGRIAARSVDGMGKRAALATYYAALHFVTLHHALEMIGPESFGPVQRILDLGCGTGAAGAALALGLGQPAPPSIVGVDRSGWALEEARETWAAFGLDGRAVRGELPLAAPRAGAGDLVLFGWSLGELPNEERGAHFRSIAAALRRGAGLLVLEPLSGRITPWWNEWAELLAEEGVRAELVRVVIQRPLFVADMDKASGLDHQIVGARVLAGRRPERAP